jgi:site-specific recombinase XerD
MDIQILAQKFYDYSTYIRGYSKDTIRRYRHGINSYSKFTGITEIEHVTGESVRQVLYDGRMNRGWRVNTFISFHKSLAVFFRWCVSEGVMAKNPTDDIELPKLEKRLPSRLTKQEALKLIEVATNYPYGDDFLRYRNNAIFSMFVFAGLRKKELLRLKYTDVDLDNMSIFVNQGKGGKDRIVPICYTLAHSLKRYLVERKRLNKTCPEFFTSSILNQGYTVTGLKRLVERMRKASGIKFTIHKLRHTFATLMLEGGCDVYSLSKMMGHSDIKTTTIYLSASAEHLRSQITKHPLNDTQLI